MFKLLVGVLILGVGVFAIIGGKLSAPSNETFINARLISVRAPVAGTVGIDDMTFGQFVARDDVVARITEPTSGSNAKEALLMLDAEQDALEEQIATLESLTVEKKRQAASYQAGRVRHLEAKVAEAKSNVMLAREKERQAAALRERQESLYSLDHIARAPLVSSQSIEASARIERQMLEKRIDTITFELDSAKNGTFIGDGYNDTTYSKQRADEIAVRMADLRAELKRKRGSARQIAMRMGASTQKLASISPNLPVLASDRPSSSAVNASNDGRVWRIVANRGDTVHSGNELLQIADCSNLFATLEVSDRSLDTVTVGQPALFQASDKSTIAGSVVFTSGSGTSYATIVGAALTPRRAETVRMSIVVALRPNSEQRARCPVGLSGRITLPQDQAETTPLPTLMRNFAARIAALVGVQV